MNTTEALLTLHSLLQQGEGIHVHSVGRWSNTGWKTAPGDRFISIEMVVAGKRRLQFESELEDQEQGGLLFLDCTEPCLLESGRFSYDFVTLEPLGSAGLFETMLQCCRTIRTLPASSGRGKTRLQTLFADMACESVLKRYAHETLILGMLQQVILLALREEYERSEERTEDNVDYGELVSRLIAYFADHLDQKHSVGELASLFQIDSRLLNRIFKRIMGVSILKYINGMRVEKAKRLLAVGELNNLEIALELGLESGQYFNYLFKRETGITPVQFRRILNGYVYPNVFLNSPGFTPDSDLNVLEK